MGFFCLFSKFSCFLFDFFNCFWWNKVLIGPGNGKSYFSKFMVTADQVSLSGHRGLLYHCKSALLLFRSPVFENQKLF